MQKPAAIPLKDLRTQAGEKSDFILEGLERKAVGFIIASPGIGKSTFCISIALELAIGSNQILGLNAKEGVNQRVLFWPIEDGLFQTTQRILKASSFFPSKQQTLIEEHIALYHSDEPIVASHRQTPARQDEVNKNLDRLIGEAKEFDLVVIDTLRDSMGMADEVNDDPSTRIALNRLAKEANVAVLAIHFPTKEISRGNGPVNSVSGSGLATTLSKSKLHIYLDQNTKKTPATLRMRHTKANFVETAKKIIEPQELNFIEDSLLLKGNNLKAVFARKPNTSTRQAKPPTDDEPPMVIQTGMDRVSEESKILATKGSNNPKVEGLAKRILKQKSEGK